MLTYRYKTIENRPAGDLKTPLIPITIKGNFAINTTAIPDSGADLTAIPLALAEAIGIDLSSSVDECVGIGGRVASKESRMRVSLGQGHERYNFEVPVKVILDSYEFPILLGRKGFFDKFLITFDERNERVKLKRNSAKNLYKH